MLPCCKSLLRFGFQKAVYMKAAKQTEKVMILKHVAREVYKISDALRGVGEMSEVKISDNLTNVQISPSNTCYYPLVRVLFHCQCLQFQREMRANLISNQQCIPYEWDHKTRIRSTCLTNTDPDPEPSAKWWLALYHSPLHPSPSLSHSPLHSLLTIQTMSPSAYPFTTYTHYIHTQYVLSFQLTTELQNKSVTLTLSPQLASFQPFSSVLTFSFIFSIFFTELRRTGLSSSLTLASVSGERGVWRSSWRAPRPICFSSCFSASFSLLSALMLSALYMWYVFITCRVERERARLAL